MEKCLLIGVFWANLGRMKVGHFMAHPTLIIFKYCSVFLKQLMMAQELNEGVVYECFIQLPELSVSEMTTFIDSVYNGRAPEEEKSRNVLSKVCDIISTKSVDVGQSFKRTDEVSFLEPKVIIEPTVHLTEGKIKEESVTTDIEVDEDTNNMMEDDDEVDNDVEPDSSKHDTKGESVCPGDDTDLTRKDDTAKSDSDNLLEQGTSTHSTSKKNSKILMTKEERAVKVGRKLLQFKSPLNYPYYHS